MATRPRTFKRLAYVLAFLSVSTIAFMLTFTAFGALMVPITGDAMDWKSRYLAGFRGTSCGRVKIGSDPKSATSCALDANAAGKPFQVIYNIQGMIPGSLVPLSGHQMGDYCP
jgi:hypothetical protein